MPLTLKQINDVCLLNQGEDQCRFLAEDQVNGDFFCIKHTGWRHTVDKEVEDYLRNYIHNVHNVPLGDNCNGYLFLRNSQQGYNVKK